MDTGINTTKINTKAVLVLSAVLFSPAIVCLIVNYAVKHSISWSLYSTGALIVLWATIIPLLIMKHHKVWGLFAGLTFTLIPYLFLINYLAGEKEWLIALGLPISIISLGTLGISLFVFTQSYINKMYASAITVFLFGVVVNFFVGKIVDGFLNENADDDISRTTTIAASTIIALLLFIAGYIKKRKAHV